MEVLSFLQSKPVLIGLHLGFAIVGIDAFFWLLGKIKDRNGSTKSRVVTAAVGTLAFVASWISGGYYYVIFYGSLVKPVIKQGLAPWAHNIVMEVKEHIFLFIIPMAVTIFFITLLHDDEIESFGIRRLALVLTALVIALGLLIGAMGFVISAAARWGAIS